MNFPKSDTAFVDCKISNKKFSEINNIGKLHNKSVLNYRGTGLRSLWLRQESSKESDFRAICNQDIQEVEPQEPVY